LEPGQEIRLFWFMDKFTQFLDSEVRYTSLKLTFPEVSETLYDKAKEEALERYMGYKCLAEN